MKTKLPAIAALALTSAFSLQPSALLFASPLGTAFTYQGHLTAAALPANGSYDLKLTLYDDGSGPGVAGGPLTNAAVAVSNGLFTVALDFGAGAFNGNARWLEIGVRTNGSGSFTTLSPRQQLTPSPYAIYAATAGTATTASSVAATNLTGRLADSQLSTNVPLLNSSPTFSGTVTAAGFTGNGAGLTNIGYAATASTVPDGAITSSKLAPGAVGSAGLAVGAVDSSRIADGAIEAQDLSTTVLSNTFWRWGGNAGTVAGTHFLGSTDNQPLELKVNNQRALRIEPNASGAPNLIGGSPSDQVSAGVVGATISGGATNSVAADYTTIGGGINNAIQSSSSWSTIGGGIENTILTNSSRATIGGGVQNTLGPNSSYSTIAGGVINTIQSGAPYSTIAGGLWNTNTGAYASIPGGRQNSATNYALAAGRRAKALHQGAFVWSDSTDADFASAGSNQFLIRASGGVGIGTNNPQSALHVLGAVTADRFIATAGDMPAAVIPVLGMAWIQPGTFIMGSPTNELGRFPDEGPQTVVTLTKGFWMGNHEVTQAEYLAVVGSNPSYFIGDTNRPVEQATWHNATNYCGLRTQAERTAGRIPSNWGYRLPTEAEWEYCCRAGARTTRFGHGDDLSYAALGNYAWYPGNSGSTTHPVEQKLANPWGLMDMHGNVREWCQDWYSYAPYPGGSVTDPTGPASGSYRVIRGGGSWNYDAMYCRSASRVYGTPTLVKYDLGFRVVLAQGQP